MNLTQLIDKTTQTNENNNINETNDALRASNATREVFCKGLYIAFAESDVYLSEKGVMTIENAHIGLGAKKSEIAPLLCEKLGFTNAHVNYILKNRNCEEFHSVLYFVVKGRTEMFSSGVPFCKWYQEQQEELAESVKDLLD